MFDRCGITFDLVTVDTCKERENAHFREINGCAVIAVIPFVEIPYLTAMRKDRRRRFCLLHSEFLSFIRLSINQASGDFDAR